MFDKSGAWLGGYSYSPYGETRAFATNATVTGNTVRYIGGYYDASVGLYRLGAREYDPTIGRFTQFDPSGQEANPYSYSGCNPINSEDPSGLSAFGCDLAIASLVVGVVAFGLGVASFIIGLLAELPTAGLSTALSIIGVVGILVGVLGVGLGVAGIECECT